VAVVAAVGRVLVGAIFDPGRKVRGSIGTQIGVPRPAVMSLMTIAQRLRHLSSSSRSGRAEGQANPAGLLLSCNREAVIGLPNNVQPIC